jgi:hypothetical protein
MAGNFIVIANRGSILKEITSKKGALARKFRREFEPILRRRQEELIKDFESHPVTKEIEAGPNATGRSGVTGGYGNLFSFIGFDVGSNPTATLREIFNRKINYNVRSIAGDGTFKITLQIPSLAEAFAVTPMPWASSSSWAEGIEKGISNIGSYVYKDNIPSSRSGAGIQVEKGAGSIFNNSPYISKIIKDFKRNLKIKR